MKGDVTLLTQQFSLYKRLNPHELTTQQFTSLEKELRHSNDPHLSDQYYDFLLWCGNHPSRQECLANFISKKLSKHPGAKILEVGCGRTARLSRFMNKNGFQMTCIDPNLDLSSIEKFEGIEGIRGKFDYRKFDISPYDYVIAQEPCDATEHIVRACVAVDKPFFMALCGVPHKLINGKLPKNHNEWYDYLKGIAPDKLKIIRLSLDPLLTTPILKSTNF